MLVIGGLGSVSGSVAGVFLITIVSEFLRNIERGFTLGPITMPAIYGSSQVILAILFVLFIVFRPRGIAGEMELDLRKFFSKKEKEVVE